MKFGPVAVGEAAGAILAHSIAHAGGTIRKGTRLTAEHAAALRSAGIAEVVVARLAPTDVHEDQAAERIAAAIAGDGVRVAPPFTGRANLYADAAGLAVVDRGLIDRLNRIDAAITIATLPESAAVAAGQMVATVKIIPFAVPRDKLDEAVAVGYGAPAIRLAAFRPLKVGLIATTLPTLKTLVMDKSRRQLDARLRPADALVAGEARVAHEVAAVADALADRRRAGDDLLIVFGASAMVDGEDVVPAAIERAGGRIVRLGMPVDPGNLLVLGDIDGTPVIGAPGCARSPKENGFDWILNRLIAGIKTTSEDIAGLGVGGLLTEIATRPQLRAGDSQRAATTGTSRIAALVLAAGRSERMGAANKLTATIGGKPLVRITVEAALASRARPVTVVTGHERGAVEATLVGLDVRLVHNPDHAGGLSTSLRAGIAGLDADLDGAVVLLADMPGVDAAAIDRLIGAFDPRAGALIVVPTHEGKRGNPVVWSSRLFADLMAVEGDTGGRHLIGANPEAVVEIELGPAVALDIDTPEALAAAGGRPA